MIDRDVILNYSGGKFLSDDRPHARERSVTEALTDLLEQNQGISKSDFAQLAFQRGLGRNRARAFVDLGVSAGEIELRAGDKNASYCYLVSSDDSAA